MTLGAYTFLDCGCKAKTFTEGDGTEYVDLEHCPMHKAAPAMLAALEDARTAIKTLDDKSLGFGKDAWHIWSLRDELLFRIAKALAAAKGEQR